MEYIIDLEDCALYIESAESLVSIIQSEFEHDTIPKERFLLALNGISLLLSYISKDANDAIAAELQAAVQLEKKGG